MRLVHFTAKPLGEIAPREQRPYAHAKPDGLWLSDEDDYGWREWCTGEDFRPESLALA